MHNCSCENEFYLHENEKSFPYQRLNTQPRFDTENRRNWEKAYWAPGSPPRNMGIDGAHWLVGVRVFMLD